MMPQWWFILTIASCVFGALSEVLQRIVLKDERVNTMAFSICFQGLVGLIALPPIIFNIGILPTSMKVWALVALISLIYAVMNILLFFALKHLEITQTTIIRSTHALWVLFGGVILFGESFNLSKVIGILLVLLGISVVYWNRGGFKGFGIWQVFVLVSALLFGVCSLLDKYLVFFFTIPVYVFLTFFPPAVFTSIMVPRAIIKIWSLLKQKNINLLVIISSALFALSAWTFYAAIKTGGEISSIVPIIQLSIILTVLIGIVFLKERENALRKIIGAVVVVAGVVIIKGM